jgi:hypothetical protein
VLQADNGVTTSESASVNLNAGEHVLVIYDYNKVSPATICYTVSIQ